MAKLEMEEKYHLQMWFLPFAIIQEITSELVCRMSYSVFLDDTWALGLLITQGNFCLFFNPITVSLLIWPWFLIWEVKVYFKMSCSTNPDFFSGHHPKKELGSYRKSKKKTQLATMKKIRFWKPWFFFSRWQPGKIPGTTLKISFQSAD